MANCKAEEPPKDKETQDFIMMLLSVNETLAQLEVIQSKLIVVKKRLEKTYWKMIE